MPGPSLPILTNQELRWLTDYKRRADQRRWLTEQGIPFLVGAAGYPKVSRQEIARRLSSHQPQGIEPNFDAPYFRR